MYSREIVPPPPEWDDLTAGLPVPGPGIDPVLFTNEPTSLKISSGTRNDLWSIDTSAPYNFANKQGCLWTYTDSLVTASPSPTSPPTGGFIGADPVTGRSQQIDLKWRPLDDIFAYDILIAKDVNFTLLLSQVLNFDVVDNITGAWTVIPYDQQQPAVFISPGCSRLEEHIIGK